MPHEYFKSFTSRCENLKIKESGNCFNTRQRICSAQWIEKSTHKSVVAHVCKNEGKATSYKLLKGYEAQTIQRSCNTKQPSAANGVYITDYNAMSGGDNTFRHTQEARAELAYISWLLLHKGVRWTNALRKQRRRSKKRANFRWKNAGA